MAACTGDIAMAMKKAIGCEKEISGIEFLDLSRPCIYMWFRGEECLYVGQSKRGIARIFGSHHIINVLNNVLPTDKFIILPTNPSYFFAGDWELVDVLSKEELKYIKRYQPRFNTTGKNTNEQESTNSLQPKKLLDMSVTLRAKEEVANLLFSAMSNESVLGLTHSDKKAADCSVYEITERLDRIRKAKRNFERLDKLNKLLKRK